MSHDHDHSEIHLPPPSLRPITMAFGITLLAAGIVTSIWLFLVGLLIFVFGLAGWIWDDIQQDRSGIANNQ